MGSDTGGTIVAYEICLMLLVFVGVIVRFWILQAMGGRGERQRLQRPEVAAVERTWRVKLPRGIETIFAERNGETV